MEIIDCQHQNMRQKNEEEPDEDELKKQQEGRTRTEEIQQENKQQQQQQPSPTSSPSHEFSFTISLQPPQISSSSSSSSCCSSSLVSSSCDKTTTTCSSTNTTSASAEKSTSKSSPPSFALDLSPADEIFFHGHLLPLHLLSHLPVSPRSSTNSLDSFTLPIKDLHHHHDHHHHQEKNSTSNQKVGQNNPMNRRIIDEYYETRDQRNINTGRPTKSKSFSLFGLSSKWRKDDHTVITKEKEDNNNNNNKERQKRKLKLDNVSHVLKRYMRMVRPLLSSFGNRRNNNTGDVRYHHREGFSYSGNLSLRRKPAELIVGRRGEFSAPASMRTSPNNSGILVASGPLSPTNFSTKSDSTMEELQAAIQAAIAHCKNSIAVEDKIKCPAEP
ncbi:OLC1v1016738C1 [Oldenlandia corymbosa var. corymbosa]|uniref:OLC1v1016738C1 n=1 Tax=Oldenlandia corymbosa var. corymbosa TaxID=529605 RepID=A0AAV1E7V6_OLDCO|nr:OLC1v1016738C1 [Oldenlandia corymbosa var. corymbosa]